MILHRFMSKREYDALMTGEVLRNETDHGAMGQKTDSVGFCFFPEPPDEAIHWLSFIVDADLCVTMEIPDAMVRKSQGRYRDVEKDKGSALFDEPPMLWRTEYCLTEYSRQTVHVLHVTDQYKWYGHIPDNTPFFELIERLRMFGERMVGEMEYRRLKH